MSTSAIGSANALVLGSGRLIQIINPYTLLWIALSMSAMIVLQFAYKHDQAIRIIPAFSANYILIPVFGGLLSFGDSILPLQWLGIAAIIAGVIILTAKPNQSSAIGFARADDLPVKKAPLGGGLASEVPARGTPASEVPASGAPEQL